MAKNDPRFLSPMGSRLAELGLDVRDVNVGRYIQIDLSSPRHEPEEFAEYGEFDTFVVLNPHDLPDGCKLWVYFNNKLPESRMPLHRISRLETIADRFFLQHGDCWEGVTLEVILGGDLRALSIDPSDKGKFTLEGNVDVQIGDDRNRELGIVTRIDEPITAAVNIDNETVVRNPRTSAVVVQQTPVQLGEPSRNSMTVHNMAETDILYIGGAGVTPANGFPVYAGQSVSLKFDFNNHVPIYAVAGQGYSVPVRIWEV